jgi:hypothetical protein
MRPWRSYCGRRIDKKIMPFERRKHFDHIKRIFERQIHNDLVCHRLRRRLMRGDDRRQDRLAEMMPVQADMLPCRREIFQHFLCPQITPSTLRFCASRLRICWYYISTGHRQVKVLAKAGNYAPNVLKYRPKGLIHRCINSNYSLYPSTWRVKDSVAGIVIDMPGYRFSHLSNNDF